MSSTPSIQAVLPHTSFDTARQPTAPAVERAPSTGAAGTADADGTAVSLSLEALARLRAEAQIVVEPVTDVPEIVAQDAALLSSLAQAQAAGIDISHPIFSDRSSSLDALALASVALAGRPTPEKAMTLVDAFYAVMRAPLEQLEPQTPPTDPLVREMKLARIRESLLPTFADANARRLIDAYLHRYLAMHPELAEKDAAADVTEVNPAARA